MVCRLVDVAFDILKSRPLVDQLIIGTPNSGQAWVEVHHPRAIQNVLRLTVEEAMELTEAAD